MLHPVPLRWNATRRGRAALCYFFALSVFVTTLFETQAQTPRTDRRKEAIVALQPFSLDEPAPVRVAYYAPRRFPRAEPVSEENEPEAILPMETTSARPIVAGSRALLRNGIAYAPSNAPANVKSAIWAANALRDKSYVWGGGHGSFNDYGYDCSGTVSFARIMLASLMRHCHRVIFSVTANAAAAGGLPSMRATGILSPSLPACASIRPTCVTVAMSVPVGTLMLATLAASPRVIPLDCSIGAQKSAR
jgi:hypothetical protein